MSALEWILTHCEYHHSAKARGYLSRVKYADKPKIEAYNGRFGVGFKLITPRYDSNCLVTVNYYIL